MPPHDDTHHSPVSSDTTWSNSSPDVLPLALETKNFLTESCWRLSPSDDPLREIWVRFELKLMFAVHKFKV